MLIYEDLEFLKLTYLMISQYHYNIKILNNIKLLFEHNINLDLIMNKDNHILVKMIMKALQAVELGIKDSKAIFQYAYEEESSAVIDLRNRIGNQVSADLANKISTAYGAILTNRPVLEKAEDIMRMMLAFKTTGIANNVENITKLRNTLDTLRGQLDKTATSHIYEDFCVTGDGQFIGRESLIRDREIEKSFVIKTFPAFDRLIGGGLRARKTYLFAGLTGSFKSGFMINVALYAMKNATIDPEFAENKAPYILYISHENTRRQTTDRVLKFNGYTAKQIEAMSHEEYMSRLNECLMPGENGIRLMIRYVESGAISIKDINRMIEESNNAGMKCVLLIEDYIKHIRCEMTPDEINEKMQKGEKLAIELSALSRKHFCPVITGSQLNRLGQTTKIEMQRKYSDYLKFLNLGHVAGSYNAAQSYESIFFIDRNYITQNKKNYFCISVGKDRDSDVDLNAADGITDYMVLPFADEVGFRLDAEKAHATVDDLNPRDRGTINAFNTAAKKMEEERIKVEVLNSAKKFLGENGYTDAEIVMMADEDILQRAVNMANEMEFEEDREEEMNIKNKTKKAA